MGSCYCQGNLRTKDFLCKDDSQRTSLVSTLGSDQVYGAYGTDQDHDLKFRAKHTQELHGYERKSELR